MTHFTSEERIAAARRYLETGINRESVSDVTSAYKLVGLAQAELSGAGVVDSAFNNLLKERLGALLVEHPDLASRGAVNIDSRACGYDDLRGSLLARSGYQVLLDAGIWDEAPLSDFHLRNCDENIAEAAELQSSPVEVPAGIPARHVWWLFGTPAT